VADELNITNNIFADLILIFLRDSNALGNEFANISIGIPIIDTITKNRMILPIDSYLNPKNRIIKKLKITIIEKIANTISAINPMENPYPKTNSKILLSLFFIFCILRSVYKM